MVYFILLYLWSNHLDGVWWEGVVAWRRYAGLITEYEFATMHMYIEVKSLQASPHMCYLM